MSSTAAETRDSAAGEPAHGGGGDHGGGGRRRRPWYLHPIGILWLLIPVAAALEVSHLLHIAEPPAWLLFMTSALGVIPCAGLMGRATEELAAKSGPGIGGLLNVTFGNFPELVIAFLALIAGLQEVVRASIVGSIIGNILLVMGASMLVGGLRHERQVFNRTAAHSQAVMLLLALVALVLPAAYDILQGGTLPTPGETRAEFPAGLQQISFIAAVVLIGSYALGLLALAAVLVGVMSEVLVGSISEASSEIGLSEFFVGVFVVAIVGNAAEHWVAVLVAAKDKMDLAVNIAIGSSAQIALFVAPLLVLLSFVIGPGPMALVFNGYELGGLLFAVLIANFLTQEGESNWFEGVQLLALYAVLGLVFFFA